MRHRLLLILSTILFLSACSHVTHMRLYNGPELNPIEEAIILLPEEFEVLELNGQSVSDSRLRFRSGNMDLRLPAGKHIIVFQYKAFWQLDDDNHDTLSSAPITFKVSMDKQEQFTFLLPELKHYEAAEIFTKKPIVSLVSQRQKINGSVGTKDNALVLIETKTPIATRYPNLEQLKFWWNRATYYEQSEFINWQKKVDQTSN